MRNLLLIVFISMPYVAFAGDALNNEYEYIVKSKCQEIMGKDAGERAIAWGCNIKRIELLNDLNIKIDSKLKAYLTKTGNKAAVDKYDEFNEAWINYLKSSKDFDMEFHTPGSMGTSGRHESEYMLVRKRTETLLEIIYSYYEIKL